MSLVGSSTWCCFGELDSGALAEARRFNHDLVTLSSGVSPRGPVMKRTTKETIRCLQNRSVNT